ncbi:MAG: peptidylprolyl isomerase [Acidimicrobiia bacterium]
MSDRRRRQKELRKAKREAERKQAARQELVRRIGTAVLFGLIVVAIFAVGSFSGREEGELPGTYEDYRNQPTACGAGTPPPEQLMTFDAPVKQTDITPDSKVMAILETSCGEIVVELDPALSPETVNSFVFLARLGFYDGQVFHRIAKDFVIQGGDPNANGSGGPGYVIPDEFPPEDFVYEDGVVAMANSGAGSTGSQFFVVIGDDARHLTNAFNVLGRVVSGEDTLDRIAAVPTRAAPGSVEESLPLETVYIESVTIRVNGS